MITGYGSAHLTKEWTDRANESAQAANSKGRASVKGRGTSYGYSDDAALIELCLAGDGLAWCSLVERYGPLVHSIARRLGLSGRDADDVLQNVFTIVFRRLASLKNHTVLAAWLITITRRESLHYAKRLPNDADLIDELMDSGPSQYAQVEQQARRLLVHQALSRLDRSSQALLSALFLEFPTPSYEQIARRLGLAVGSIGPARARCLKKLEAALEAMDPDAFRSLADE